MPVDASDRIRRLQATTNFTGWAIQQQTLQPGVNVSSCTTFYTSTIQKFGTYEYANQIEQGRIYFSTCQGIQRLR
jgi:hypothetical protein